MGRAATDGFGNYTKSRTVQDDIISDIEYGRRQAAKDASRANRQRLEDEAQQHRLDSFNEYLERANREQAIKEANAREQWQRELHEAAVRVREEFERKVEQGDPDALMRQAKEEHDGRNFRWAVHHYLGVRGPHAAEALESAIDIIRAHPEVTFGDGEGPGQLFALELMLADQGSPKGHRLAADECLRREWYEKAAYYYAKPASLGDKTGRHNLIRLLAENRVSSVAVSPADFHEWCSTYAAEGDLPSQVLWSRHLTEEGKKDEARVWNEKVAALDPKKLDDREQRLWSYCANRVGVERVLGLGAEKDLAGGRALLERAAALNYAPAMKNLGDLAARDSEGKADLAAAAGWWRKAAVAGSVPAMKTLLSVYGGLNSPLYDELEAMRWQRYAADFDPEIAIAAGISYCTGRSVYAANPSLGHDLIAKAWERFPSSGYVKWQIGAMKLTGQCGFAADPAEALALVHAAVDGGEPRAARTLEKAYTRGLGVAADPAEAQKWKLLADAARAPAFSD